MAKNLTNRQRKEIFGNALKVQQALIQASIDTRKEKRVENRRKLHELAEAQEKLRLQQLANLKKKMVIMFAKIGNKIFILTIVDPSLMKSSYSFRMKHHITYGSPDYEKIRMKASYSIRGKRSERDNAYSYTVSTADGFNFDIIGLDGTTSTSFETLIHYESLAGKSFSDVQFDQFFYDPFKDSIDDETAKFDEELKRLIEADAEYVSKNPELLEEGYIAYFSGKPKGKPVHVFMNGESGEVFMVPTSE